MKQYIDKSALVAEIERWGKICEDYMALHRDAVGQGIANAKRRVCQQIIEFINTLEVKEISDEYNGFLGKELKIVDNEIARLEKLKVKEVDLEKEFDKYCENYIFDDECEVYTARHFFELGFKARKEKEV